MPSGFEMSFLVFGLNLTKTSFTNKHVSKYRLHQNKGQEEDKGKSHLQAGVQVYIYIPNFDHSAKTTLVRNAKPMNSKLKSYRYFFTSTLAIFRNASLTNLIDTLHINKESGQQTQKRPWPSPPNLLYNLTRELPAHCQ